MDTLERYAREAFERRMHAVLKAAHPEIVHKMPEVEFSSRISAGIDEAIGHGITHLGDIEKYLHFSLRFGLGFEHIDPDKAWISKILQDTSLSGTEKVMLVGDVIDWEG
jgi:hypothetical protein